MAETDDHGSTEDHGLADTSGGEVPAARKPTEPVKIAVDQRKSEDEQLDDLVAELTALGMNPDREALRSVVRKRSS